MKKIDIFAHIFPKAYFEKLVEIVPNKEAIRRWTDIPVLYDLERRLGMTDAFEQYQQVLTLSMPAVEYVASPDASPALARLAIDGMDLSEAERAQLYAGNARRLLKLPG